MGGKIVLDSWENVVTYRTLCEEKEIVKIIDQLIVLPDQFSEMLA